MPFKWTKSLCGALCSRLLGVKQAVDMWTKPKFSVVCARAKSFNSIMLRPEVLYLYPECLHENNHCWDQVYNFVNRTINIRFAGPNI